MKHSLAGEPQQSPKGPGKLAQLLTATRLGWFWVANLLLAGLIGFVPNPLVGEGGIFAANTAHNLFHIISATGLVIAILVGSKAASWFMMAFGPTYGALGILGFLVTGPHGDGHLLGVVHINTADNILHIILGGLIGFSGWIAQKHLHMYIAKASDHANSEDNPPPS